MNKFKIIKAALVAAPKSIKTALVAAPASLLVSAQAHAQSAGVDVSDVVTEISGAKGPIGSIGTTVLGVIVTIAVFVWIRRAIK